MWGVTEKEIRDDFKVFDLNNWKDRVTINKLGESVVEEVYRGRSELFFTYHFLRPLLDIQVI